MARMRNSVLIIKDTRCKQWASHMMQHSLFVLHSIQRCCRDMWANQQRKKYAPPHTAVGVSFSFTTGNMVIKTLAKEKLNDYHRIIK